MHVHTWSDHDFTTVPGERRHDGARHVRLAATPRVARRDRSPESSTGPTLFTAGPIVDGDPPTWPGSAVVKTADEARERVVREQKKAGYDFIKVYRTLSSRRTTRSSPKRRRRTSRSPVTCPKAVGLEQGDRERPTLDRAPRWLHPDSAASRTPTRTIIAATVKSGVWNCPTLVVTDRIGRIDNPMASRRRQASSTCRRPCASNGIPRTTSASRAGRRRCSRHSREERASGESSSPTSAERALNSCSVPIPAIHTSSPAFAVHDELALLVSAASRRGRRCAWQQPRPRSSSIRRVGSARS